MSSGRNHAKSNAQVEAQLNDQLAISTDFYESQTKLGIPVILKEDLVNIDDGFFASGSSSYHYKAALKQDDFIFKVDLKILKLKEPQSDSKVLCQFAKEEIAITHVINELKSPYIIFFYGLTLMRLGLAMVFEFASEQDLFHYLKKNGSALNWGDNVRYDITENIAQGLKVLHENKIIHRDIKPDNIFILKTDGKIIAKIGDFGFAQQGQIFETPIGTYRFAAPEVVTARTYNCMADIFSLAVTMYTLATLTLPFGNLVDRDSDVMNLHVEGKRARISDTVPKGYATLIKRCWDPSPANRLSAATVCDEVNAMKMKI